MERIRTHGRAMGFREESKRIGLRKGAGIPGGFQDAAGGEALRGWFQHMQQAFRGRENEAIRCWRRAFGGIRSLRGYRTYRRGAKAFDARWSWCESDSA